MLDAAAIGRRAIRFPLLQDALHYVLLVCSDVFKLGKLWQLIFSLINIEVPLIPDVFKWVV